ncbi:Hsp20/alpha crystallin family protein [Virgibacillus sp. DJP39]|uniref:Hsp20/alpha crystallin family protein n=1 Tax=Virgibacillus sp. DJP39 TaxID=3409790 RepID=UPI003BB4E670
MSLSKVYGENSTNNYDPTNETTTEKVPRTPRLDVYESETVYYLRLSIPGVKKENLTVHFKNVTDLEIQGYVKPSHPVHIDRLITQEIFEGPFYRFVRFPTTIQPESIHFDYYGGILEIFVEKNVSEGES